MSRGALLGALVVLAVAAGWRLRGLSEWSLDGDELFSHYDAATIVEGGAWPQGARSHPLGYALMAASVKLLGPGELALRLPSALAGLGAVAALLWLRRDAVPRGEALAAGALAAISPWLIYHSQEARFYGPLFVFATLATLWALPGIGRRPWLALSSALLAALCHPSALLLIPGVGLLLWAGRVSPRRLAAAVVGVAAVGALWLLLGDRALLDVVRTAFSRRGFADYDAAHLLAGLGYNLGIGTGALVLASLSALRRSPRDGDRALLCAAVLPPVLLLALGLAGVSVHHRYALVAVPATLLLAGRGLLAAAGRPVFTTALAGLALLAPIPELVAYAQGGDRHDFRAAAAWLATNARPDDIVVADDHSIVDLYLLRHPAWKGALLHEAPLPPRFMAQFPHDKRTVWVVVKRNRMRGAYGPEFTAWVGRHFDRVADIGAPPPPLARHDNVLLIYQRRERLHR